MRRLGQRYENQYGKTSMAMDTALPTIAPPINPTKRLSVVRSTPHLGEAFALRFHTHARPRPAKSHGSPITIIVSIRTNLRPTAAMVKR